MFCDVSRIDYSARRRYTLRVVEKRLATQTKNSKKKRDVKFAESARIFAKEEKWKKLGGEFRQLHSSRKKKKKEAKIFKTKQNKARARDKRKTSVER